MLHGLRLGFYLLGTHTALVLILPNWVMFRGGLVVGRGKGEQTQFSLGKRGGWQEGGALSHQPTYLGTLKIAYGVD